MTTENTETLIRQMIEQLLKALNIEGSVSFNAVQEKKTQVKVAINDGSQGYIIGKQGGTLEALQHLVSLIARKEKSEVQYRVDINDYQEERDQQFLKRVHEYVMEKEESQELLLWPMTPYERRLVHEYFLKLGTHVTESEDFGSKRVVRVIKK